MLKILRHAAVSMLMSIFAAASCHAAGPSDVVAVVPTLNADEQSLLAVVAQRIDGYNAHDIDEFLTAHAEQVQIYEFPERKIGVGRAHLRRIFAPQFELGLGRIQVIEQIVIGHRVISHEYITVDERIEHLVIVYSINDGEISSFRLIESDE